MINTYSLCAGIMKGGAKHLGIVPEFFGRGYHIEHLSKKSGGK
jgi:hypothetical protein